jgi:hypothetical protein
MMSEVMCMNQKVIFQRLSKMKGRGLMCSRMKDVEIIYTAMMMPNLTYFKVTYIEPWSNEADTKFNYLASKYALQAPARQQGATDMARYTWSGVNPTSCGANNKCICRKQ